MPKKSKITLEEIENKLLTRLDGTSLYKHWKFPAKTLVKYDGAENRFYLYEGTSFTRDDFYENKSLVTERDFREAAKLIHLRITNS